MSIKTLIVTALMGLLAACATLEGTDALQSDRPYDEVFLACVEAVKASPDLRLEFPDTMRGYIRAVQQDPDPRNQGVFEIYLDRKPERETITIRVETTAGHAINPDRILILEEQLYQRIAQRIEEIERRQSFGQ